MAEAGVVKLRVDAVMGLELLFTLPSGSNIDVNKYFTSATEWAEDYYGVPVLSSVIHLDESAPHCHVLLLPLVGKKMVGSDLHGHASKLRAMQASFSERVSSRYGFCRAPSKSRFTLIQRKEAVLLARESLQHHSGLNDSIIDVLLEPHRKNPEALILALGLSMPAPKVRKTKSFVDMMIRPVRKEDDRSKSVIEANPIGLEKSNKRVEREPYSCVGFNLPIRLDASVSLGSYESANAPKDGHYPHVNYVLPAWVKANAYRNELRGIP